MSQSPSVLQNISKNSMQTSLETHVPNVDKWGCFESCEQPWAEWYNLDMFVHDCICRL